jgi:ATP-dependent DNA helicase DinG
MPYGRKLRAALPAMGTLDTEADAMAWLDQIAAANAAG